MDVDEARMIVEGIAVDSVRGLLGREHEDCAGLGVGVVRFSCRRSALSLVTVSCEGHLELDVRWPPMGSEALCTMSEGALTA